MTYSTWLFKDPGYDVIVLIIIHRLTQLVKLCVFVCIVIVFMCHLPSPYCSNLSSFSSSFPFFTLSLPPSPSLTHSISGCSHHLSSPTRLTQSSENNSVAHSDAESDSGFESAAHVCVSEALDNGPTAVATSEDSQSDDDERIKQAILHLDVKVWVQLVPFFVPFYTIIVLTSSKESDVRVS